MKHAPSQGHNQLPGEKTPVELYHEQIFDALGAQTGVRTDTIPDHVRKAGNSFGFQPGPLTTFIKPDALNPLATLETGRTKQSLSAVIKAGGEHYAVIDCTQSTTYETHGQSELSVARVSLLAKIGDEGEPATLVGAFGDHRPLRVGRKHRNADSELTSKEHFEISGSTSRIKVTDLESTNKTHISYPESSVDHLMETLREPQPQANGKFGLAALKKHITKDKPNPLVNPAVWAVTVPEVEEAFRQNYDAPTKQL